MRNDRLLFTAFAMGYLGWKRTLKCSLIGAGFGFSFLIVMWVLANPAPVVVMPVLTQAEMISEWSADKQTRVYLLTVGFCCPGCEQVPQCNN